MKRDMSLVREILLKVENISLTEQLYSGDIFIDGYDADTISYHCKLMIEHELVVGEITRYIDDTTPGSYLVALTWEGHDFLDACRDENRWKKAQGLFKAAGDVSFDVMKNTLSTLATDTIKSLL